jgi:RHS repeat-associated protein
VLVTISDKKLAVESDNDGVVNYYNADVVTASDYYPFGSQMPGRKFSQANSSYRYGFNGKEKDNEISCDGNHLDFGARVYDSRLGRFLTRDPQEKIFVYQSTYCYASNNPIRFVDVNGEGPGLDLKSLQGNKNFRGLTVQDTRQMVRGAYPSLQDYQVNISAGHLLENAYADFSGFPKNKETMLSSVSKWGIRGINPRKIKPDFIQATQYTGSVKEGTLTFPYGGYYEVTATSQVITLQVKDKQIEAYFNKLPYARTSDLDNTAGDKNAAQLTLVVPFGTLIGDDVKKMATDNGVNLYVSYAFINTKTNAIVFSNPEKINTKMRNEMPYPDIGNIDKPATADATKACAIWKDEKTAKTKTNEADN